MDPSTASVQGVPGLFGSAGPSVVGTSVRAPADTSAAATEARRRRLAVAGVSLMGAAAVSTAVFQTVTGTSTTLAMTGGLGAFLDSTATPTPQGPVAAPAAPAAPAITDLGSLSSTPPAPTSPEVELRASRGPLAGPGDLPDPTRTAPAERATHGGGAPGSAPSPGRWSGSPGHVGSGGPSTGSSSSTTAPSSTSPTTPPSSTTPSSTTPTTKPPSTAPPNSTTPTTTEPPKTDLPKSDLPKSEPAKSEPPKPEPSSGQKPPSAPSGGEQPKPS